MAATHVRSMIRLRTAEKVVATLCLVVLALALVALARGGGQVWRLPLPVLVHILTVVPALAIGAFILLRPKGLPMHRALGWLFATLMMTTAVVTWWVRVLTPGHFSAIHLFSVLVVVTVPLIVAMARAHRIERHRRGILRLMTGSLVLAGFFTLLPGRIIGHWLFGG